MVVGSVLHISILFAHNRCSPLTSSFVAAILLFLSAVSCFVAADIEAEHTPKLGPWSTAESPGMALCSAKSLSGALVATSLSAIVTMFVCVFVGLPCQEL